jgi:hypothetical protein
MTLEDICDIYCYRIAATSFGLPYKINHTILYAFIQAEIKSRLKLDNACYYSAQNLLSSRLLSKNLKIKIYRTIILPVVVYGYEAWSLTLREERRLKVFENTCCVYPVSLRTALDTHTA